MRDYGAVGDNATDEFKIYSAFEAIAAVPAAASWWAGRRSVFLIRPVNLSSSLEFYIRLPAGRRDRRRDRGPLP